MEDLQPNEARLLRKGATKAPTVRASTIRRRAKYIPNNRRPIAGSSSKNFFGASTRTPRDVAFSRANVWIHPNNNKDSGEWIAMGHPLYRRQRRWGYLLPAFVR